jgi:hypothetical protein
MKKFKNHHSYDVVILPECYALKNSWPQVCDQVYVPCLSNFLLYLNHDYSRNQTELRLSGNEFVQPVPTSGAVPPKVHNRAYVYYL